MKLGIYRHIETDTFYTVIAIGKNANDCLQSLVVYQPLYDRTVTWVRPLTEFAEEGRFEFQDL